MKSASQTTPDAAPETGAWPGQASTLWRRKMRGNLRRNLLLLLLLANAILGWAALPAPMLARLLSSLSVFATIFLGIFIEAAPFLLLGTIGSGLVEVYLRQDWLAQRMPNRALPAALAGGLLGLAFPVCECGVVPLSRRLLRKGLPVPAGIAFLLAAPVLNPVVIFSTAAAFGLGRIFWLRMALTLIIAVITGLVFSVVKTPWDVLRPTAWITATDFEPARDAAGQENAPRRRWLAHDLGRVLLVAMDEFFEMGRYMIIGALLAAAMQTYIPQSFLLQIGQGPLLSVLALMALAIILSICSTVDAFIALGFVGAFSQGAILAFLVFGPMVDIKSTLMFLRVFRRRPVAYLILLPLLMSLLAGLLINFGYLM